MVEIKFYGRHKGGSIRDGVLLDVIGSRVGVDAERTRTAVRALKGMSPGDEGFDVAYLVLSGTTTAARCPELLRWLVGLGFSTVIAIPTPNASRVIAPRDLADVEGLQVVESYFDLAIRPLPPRGVVLFAPR